MSVSLVKGQKISLEKGGKGLRNVCVGLNWGAIEKKGFFGGRKIEAVDLDASCGAFDAAGERVEVAYFGRLSSSDGSIRHSGDDRTGDTDGDDGLDNEIISLDLQNVSANVEKIVFVLNSFEGHDFAIVPFATIRIYEGTPTRVDHVLATYNIASDRKFANRVSMIMGRLYRHNKEWKFAAIGEPTVDKKLDQTLQTAQKNFLD